MTKRIRSLAKNLQGLMLEILHRVISESALFKGQNLVENLICSLCVAGPFGINEMELGNLLANIEMKTSEHKKEGTENEIDLEETKVVPPFLIAQILRELKPFVSISPFATVIFSKSVIERMIVHELFGEEDSERRT